MKTPYSMSPTARTAAATRSAGRMAGVIKASYPDFRYELLSPPEVVGDGGESVGWKAALASGRRSPEPIS
jgi:hypothetical protein